MGGDFFLEVVLHGTVQLFTNKAEAVSEAAAPFDWGWVQGINIHGIWIMSWAQGLGAMGEVGVCVLWSLSLVHQSNFLSDLPLETEMGSFFIPADNGGGDVVHSLDSLHNPNRDSSGEVGDECGSIFDFIILGTDDI